MIRTNRIINPFYLYALGFIFTLCVFSLRWSYIFNVKLGSGLLTFIFVTSFISIILGKLPIVIKKNIFKPIRVSRYNKRAFVLIWIGFILEFLYCRSIPLIDVVVFNTGGYRDFTGIPILHVVLSNINYFWGLYIFIQYLSNKEHKYLKKYILLSYLPYLFLINRGAITQLLLSSIFIYLLYLGHITARKILVFVLGGLAFFILFGAIGNARQANTQEDHTAILKMGGATEEFVDSKNPKLLFWGYLYIASPIANLQTAINYKKSTVPSLEEFINLNIDCCMPDFISNRIKNYILDDDQTLLNSNYYLITEIFNAPSVFFLPYLRCGWLGIIWMYIFMIIVVLTYCLIIPQSSKYFLIGWSSILSIITLNTFNNMWYNSGTILLITFIAVIYEQFRPYLKYLKGPCSSNSLPKANFNGKRQYF